MVDVGGAAGDRGKVPVLFANEEAERTWWECLVRLNASHDGAPVLAVARSQPCGQPSEAEACRPDGGIRA
jgi:hypothetical protein